MSFTADLSKFCHKEAPEKTGAIIRGIMLEITNRVIQRSPVGDARYWQSPPPPGYVGGRFRGNWQYRYSTPENGAIDRIDPSGRVTLDTIQSGIALSKVSGVHWITNNLPYAERLENGWSNQAPQGVVSLTEIEFPQIVREVIG